MRIESLDAVFTSHSPSPLVSKAALPLQIPPTGRSLLDADVLRIINTGLKSCADIDQRYITYGRVRENIVVSQGISPIR